MNMFYIWAHDINIYSHMRLLLPVPLPANGHRDCIRRDPDGTCGMEVPLDFLVVYKYIGM